jgi:hypothetical protein
MAQADSVRSSSRQLMTGESASQSTSLRAVNLPAVRVQPVDRHYLIGRSDVRVTTGTEDLSNCRWYAAGTGQEPLGSNIGALSFETAFLLGRLLRNVLILLRFRSTNKHLRFSAFDKVSSNQLVRSKPQGRLR